MPATNVFIEGYELDAFWPGERFAVELDGYEFHRTRAAFERDRRRQEDLKVAGVEMIRVTARRLDEEPSELAARIALLLGRRRAGPHRSG
jgi:very-short-patch-repair endonuclease